MSLTNNIIKNCLKYSVNKNIQGHEKEGELAREGSPMHPEHIDSRVEPPMSDYFKEIPDGCISDVNRNLTYLDH